MKRVVIYARYSSDNQSETSIEQQIQVCLEHCRRNNYTVVAEYKDEAISGRTDERPQFQKMIKDSESKLFQDVLVYSVDRFSRNLYHSAKYLHELEINGVSILSATEPIDDTPAGKFILNMLQANAQHYSDSLSQKVKRGMDYNAEHGYVTGGNFTLGYKVALTEYGKRKYVVDEETAHIVKRIFEMYADEHKTMPQILQHLNEQGIKTIKGVPYTKNSIRNIIMNKRYCGIYIYKDKEFPGKIPRLIDDDLFERAQKVRERNKKAPAKNKAIGENEYLLYSKLYCGHCKKLMTSGGGTSKTKKLYRYYTCKGRQKKKCNKANVGKEWIEDIVVQQCRAILTDENIEKIATDIVAFNEAEQRNNTNLKRLENQISEIDKSIENLMKALEQGQIADLIADRISKKREERAELEKSLLLEQSRKITITRREIIFFLTDLQNGDITDFKYRKVLINTIIDKVYLYDDGRLTIILYNGDTTAKIAINTIDDVEKDVPIYKDNESSFLSTLPLPALTSECSVITACSGVFIFPDFSFLTHFLSFLTLF